MISFIAKHWEIRRILKAIVYTTDVHSNDRLRVLDYRSERPGSIPGTTRYSEGGKKKEEKKRENK
jgi:hypothetical protein